MKNEDEKGFDATRDLQSLNPRGTLVLGVGGAAQLAGINPDRRFIIITNHGANPATLTLRTPAAAGLGIYLAANGGWASFNRNAEDWRGEVFAFSALGTTLGILEV
jgi:hypothetical protein